MENIMIMANRNFMDSIKKDRDEFEELLKAKMYEVIVGKKIGSAFSSVKSFFGFGPTNMEIYDNIRKIVDNNEGFEGYTEEEYNPIKEATLTYGNNVKNNTEAFLTSNFGIFNNKFTTTGTNNVTMGYKTTPFDNIGFGHCALNSITTGTNNIAFGHNSRAYGFIYYEWFIDYDTGVMLDDNTLFLFCYYLNLHNNEVFRDAIKSIRYFFKTNVLDYSSIGATLIAKCSNLKLKRELINKMLAKGCEITLKDEQLAIYMRYEIIYKQKLQIAQLLLCGLDNIDYDSRMLIMDFLIGQCNKDLTFW